MVKDCPSGYSRAIVSSLVVLSLLRFTLFDSLILQGNLALFSAGTTLAPFDDAYHLTEGTHQF